MSRIVSFTRKSEIIFITKIIVIQYNKKYLKNFFLLRKKIAHLL